MRVKKLSELLKELPHKFYQDSQGAQVKGIAYDSRDVQRDFAFFALKGLHTDGHEYINQAIKLGASVIIHSESLKDYSDEVAYVMVEDTRFAMSPFSAAFYEHPSREIDLIGVTGTDGKSTTVSLIAQLLELKGNMIGFLSTVNFKMGDDLQKNHFRQSTPEAPEIQRLLREMVDKGLDYGVIEATSHGLSKMNNRLGDVDFQAAVMTNVTREHLEFHGTIEHYREDKANLFRRVADNDDEMAFGVVNMDDENVELFMDALGEKPYFCFSRNSEDADMHLSNIEVHSLGCEATLCFPGDSMDIDLNIPGEVNLENLMAALLVVMELEGLEPEDFQKDIPLLKGVEGRMEPITGSQDFQVMVDYAHTPGSFEKLLPSLKKNCLGRLICVFGSAGERDVEKRPMQGAIADQWSDIIILTDEDPRLEDSMKIIEDIAKGIKNRKEGENLFKIPPRKEALQKALELAQKDDLVISLGKGHEGSIIYSDGPKDWNEVEIMSELLRKRGF
ncbi:MAG: UDP-N-acetylmuramoyl-L-alanyl-D-glutamate--2,6-diaminopimelate ligase [Spirochaetaceae bacterium]|jgi:UDP-N-acetylmuramoyl-L-alanyl-D-glutamate--2,6-diaminopimelate ligase|nr:UDP-N-acetylmuramoyl-L-alanyl-D-glutamate--2,6-diaminopimelate ligase [Spirochaetaceae bacterium]